MQASKVEVNSELLSEQLPKKRKAELRRQRIVELIESKPVGAQIKLVEFATVTNMSTGSVHGFLQQMVKRGIISVEKLTPSELTYHVLSDKPRHEWKTITPHEHHSQHGESVTDLAHQFFWETQSDSLHEFVEWVAKNK